MSLESLDFSGVWEATVEMKDARRRELTQLGKEVRKYFHLCGWNMNNSVICGGSREGF